MTRTLLALSLAAFVAWPQAEVSAHHPFSAVYAMEDAITVEGEVVGLVLRKPHSYLHLSVRDDTDQTHHWAVEWESRDDGRGPGGPMAVLKVGDRVVATGHPGRDAGAFRILVSAIVRPADGWRWTRPAR